MGLSAMSQTLIVSLTPGVALGRPLLLPLFLRVAPMSWGRGPPSTVVRGAARILTGYEF